MKKEAKEKNEMRNDTLGDESMERRTETEIDKQTDRQKKWREREGGGGNRKIDR